MVRATIRQWFRRCGSSTWWGWNGALDYDPAVQARLEFRIRGGLAIFKIPDFGGTQSDTHGSGGGAQFQPDPRRCSGSATEIARAGMRPSAPTTITNATCWRIATTQVTYNTDCCGISVEYRRFNIGTRDDTQYRIAFAVSNVGTFGTLKKQERILLSTAASWGAMPAITGARTPRARSLHPAKYVNSRALCSTFCFRIGELPFQRVKLVGHVQAREHGRAAWHPRSRHGPRSWTSDRPPFGRAILSAPALRSRAANKSG